MYRNDRETQEELSDYLEERGVFRSCEATVSRGYPLFCERNYKAFDERRQQKYVALVEMLEDLSEKYTRIFRDGFLSMDMAQNILVIKTVEHGHGGCCRALCNASPRDRGRIARHDHVRDPQV